MINTFSDDNNFDLAPKPEFPKFFVSPEAQEYKVSQKKLKNNDYTSKEKQRLEIVKELFSKSLVGRKSDFGLDVNKISEDEVYYYSFDKSKIIDEKIFDLAKDDMEKK